MHFYLQGMINAQEEWKGVSALPSGTLMPMRFFNIFDPLNWVNLRTIGETAYGIITLILYFNAISEDANAAEGSAAAS